MAEAFENCALGMISLMFDPGRVRPRRRVRLSAHGGDGKSLLVAWLSEILFQVETEGWAFSSFEIRELSEVAAAGWGTGEPLDPGRHAVEREIKAPTYHMLELEERDGAWTAQVIFDV
jgi:SHS2 domain-containing protein